MATRYNSMLVIVTLRKISDLNIKSTFGLEMTCAHVAEFV